MITALFGMTLVGSIGEWIGRALRRHFRRHREQGAPIPKTIIGVNIGAGAVTIVYTLALLFKQVELWAWQPPSTLPGGELNVFPMAVYTLFPCALVVLWSGAIQIWTGLGACELSAFNEIVAQHRRWENNRRETLKRTAIIMGVVLVSWAANADANGWALGLALALGCGSVGLFSGLAMSLDQGKSAPKGGGDPNITFRLSSLLVDVNPFTAGRLGFTILIAVLIGAATLRIWREASTNYAYLEELAANGKAR